MAVEVTRTFPALDELTLVTVDDMRQIGLLIRERIVRRTVSGVDALGAPFAAYSPAYAKAKAKAIGGSGVNLQVSGAMLNDLTIVDVQADAETAQVTLGWTR
jgi:hypothetical protein